MLFFSLSLTTRLCSSSPSLPSSFASSVYISLLASSLMRSSMFCSPSMTYVFKQANIQLLQLRWLRPQIHQGPVLHGRPPSPGQAPHHPRRLARWLRWQFRLQRHRQGLPRTWRALRRYAHAACCPRHPHRPHYVLDPESLWLPYLNGGNGRYPCHFRERPHHPVSLHSFGFASYHLHGSYCIGLCQFLKSA